MLPPLRLALVTLAVLTSALHDGCATDADCVFNGICGAAATCICDAPWSGPSCAQLTFARTRAVAKSLYNITDPHNTWDGPIVTGPDGKLHMYLPLYKPGSLGSPQSLLHGLADAVEGPWDWTSLPEITDHVGINPGFLVFPGADGAPVYALFVDGACLTASSPYGPFTPVPGFSLPKTPAGNNNNNPAPIYFRGAFYLTTQFTQYIWTAPYLGAPWTVFANISHSALPTNEYHVEDPFMWIDSRDHWHIVNHAYSNSQFVNCGVSAVSAHFFSSDGLTWGFSEQPWSHTVEYDDGTNHTYVTLERPYLFFNAQKQLTHVQFAADMVTGDEGCASRPNHTPPRGPTPCDNCKWEDHAGTIVVALAAT